MATRGLCVNSLEPRCSEPRRSKPLCLWRSLFVNLLEPQCSEPGACWSFVLKDVHGGDTGSRGKNGAGNSEKSSLYCKQPLCIYLASGFLMSLRAAAFSSFIIEGGFFMPGGANSVGLRIHGFFLLHLPKEAFTSSRLINIYLA
jgi:hypothetical protein